MIIDTDTGALIEAVENTTAAQPQGAGIAAVKLVLDKDVETVLTGSAGPNATSVFQTIGVIQKAALMVMRASFITSDPGFTPFYTNTTFLINPLG